MVVESYRELFSAVATTGGALTGLLFVALSVAPRQRLLPGHPVIRQVRAAAALLCFLNALTVSLFALVPTTSVGYPALALGVIGTMFTAAAIRSVVSSHLARRTQLRQVGLFALLLLIFVTELVCGIAVLANPASVTLVQLIGYALISSLIVGISRAWELVGDRETGLAASVAVLFGHSREQGDGAGAGVAGAEAAAAEGAAHSSSGGAAECEPGADQPGRQEH